MPSISNLSKLGFGLSSIAGSGNFSHQQALIKTAIDNGITHFDVAPYYGSGDAEKILGDVLSTCSQKVTITTKFGLIPFNGGFTGSLLRSALRPVLRRISSLKRVLSSVISISHQPKKKFEKGSLLDSLEASINKLQRPVDIFLLHDPNLDFAKDMDVVEELTYARKTGKTLLTGISGSADIIQNSVSWDFDTYTVAQLENSLTCPAPISALLQSGVGIITHRSIQGGLNNLIFLLEKRPGFKKVWSREIGIDPSNIENLAQVLLELALSENSTGTVLFSTTHPDRVKKLASIVTSPILGEEGCRHLRKLFNEVYLVRRDIVV